MMRSEIGAGTRPSAVDWLARLDARELSSRELTEEYLHRLEEVAHLNAVVALDGDRAMAEAGQADRDRARGKPGRLCGLPMTVKDALDVAGYPTRAGSLAREGHLATQDASVVSRLRNAGAVVLAKTNVPEASSSYETDNAIFGRTNHPLDPEHTPGGSSGGEGALLGADASMLGIGADGGGSIRVPAHYCGVLGMRPTTGRTPETGQWPGTRATGMMDLTCVGPMARYVADLGLMLETMSGPDGIDPYAVPVALPDWRNRSVSEMRIGFYAVDPAVSRTTRDTQHAVRDAARALVEAGARVSEVEVPDLSTATELFFAAVGADAGASLKTAVQGASRHHPQFRALLESLDGPSPTAESFFELQQRFFAFRTKVRAFVGAWDAVLCPVVAGPAPLHNRPPAGLGDDDDFLAYEAFNYCHTYAVGGLPAVSVPAGRQNGLPIGVQVVAPAFREDNALAVAAVIEEVLGGFAINRDLAGRLGMCAIALDI